MKLFSAGSLPTGIRVRQTFHTIIHAGRSDLGSRAPGSTDDHSEGVRREFIEMASGCRYSPRADTDATSATTATAAPFCDPVQAVAPMPKPTICQPHAFNEALPVKLFLSPERAKLAEFSPAAAGLYRRYCGLFSHRSILRNEGFPHAVRSRAPQG